MPRARGLLLALLLTTAGLAGCLGSQQTADPADGRPAADPTGGSLASELYLTGAMALTPTPPTSDEPEAVPVGSFYTAWAQGDEQPTWTAKGPVEAPVRITEAALSFHYTAETAVVTTGPQDQGFPEFVVYLGTEAAPMAWASVAGPDIVQEGEIVEAEAPLTLPEGGLVLPAGAMPVVKIAPVQAQQEQGARLEVLVNATSTPSRVELTTEPIELVETTEQPVLDEEGQLAGSAYALGQTEGASSMSFPVEVPATAVGLTASLERTTGVGIADIDLEVQAPDGTIIAQSVTPEDDEGLALYAPNLAVGGPGTWTLVVTNYGNVVTGFHLTAQLLEPAS